MTHRKKGVDLFNASRERMSRANLKLSLICILIAVFIGILYFNSLRNQFTNWDDSMIYANPQVRSLGWDNIRSIFAFVKGSTYQPVRVLSYAMDYYFWKLDPVGYHLSN